MASVLLGPKSSETNAQGFPPAEPVYETKIYNIADLLDSPVMLDDNDPGATTATGKSGPFNGGGFGGGGMGGGSDANVGGGGFFRVPDNILPQFGGGGMVGGNLGGGMGAGLDGGIFSKVSPNITAMAIEQLVLDHVSDDATQWLEVDGAGGRLSILGTMMVVTHTADVQARVGQLLDALRLNENTSPMVQVDVRIVEVPSDQTVAALTTDAKSIDQLANDSSAARMSLRCNNHRSATVSSGLRRSYVVSIVPVVGSNGIADGQSHRDVAYQPVTYSTLLGLFGKIKPEIATDGKSGRIHMGIRSASGPDEVMSTTFGTGQSIDRVELDTAELETSIESDADRWVLAGSVAVTDPTSRITSGAALPHLAVLVRWSVVK
ncbi:MAG: hypothetical protein KDB00_18115 [Planctomycetales bacterium]|nr:hypothetical protein [Planctomycetales bacterium]